MLIMMKKSENAECKTGKVPPVTAGLLCLHNESKKMTINGQKNIVKKISMWYDDTVLYLI